MAEWLYEIQRVSPVTDQQLEDVLRERGSEGWELVQVLSADQQLESTRYRLIFKAQKPQVAGSSGN